MDEMAGAFLDSFKIKDQIFEDTGVEFEDYEESLRFFG
jgi:hypothetical protein